jgi:hypothetical protein
MEQNTAVVGKVDGVITCQHLFGGQTLKGMSHQPQQDALEIGFKTRCSGRVSGICLPSMALGE